MMCGPRLIRTHIWGGRSAARGLWEIVKGLDSLTPPRRGLSGSADAATKGKPLVLRPQQRGRWVIVRMWHYKRGPVIITWLLLRLKRVFLRNCHTNSHNMLEKLHAFLHGLLRLLFGFKFIFNLTIWVESHSNGATDFWFGFLMWLRRQQWVTGPITRADPKWAHRYIKLEG